ncbi:MAG: hypothetical protein HY330_01810 [Chloroflexi bacterium]|nr:hypothetical protein [Chloroflexota bacterium]
MRIQIDPSEGIPLIGKVARDGSFFAGLVLTKVLFNLTENPLLVEQAKFREASPNMQEVADLREQVQRLFIGAKKKNVASYAKYLLSMLDGAHGVVPPIVLWTPDKLKLIMEESAEAIIVPFGKLMIAIDGETQLAARYEARKEDQRILETEVPVIIHHEKPAPWARQAFHDLNTFGVRPNAALSISMDEREPLTGIARQVEKEVALFTGRVSHSKRQLGARDKEIVTLSALRLGCVTFAKGITGVQFGSRPVELAPGDTERVGHAAVTWFNAVAGVMGNAFSDRRAVAGSATAMAAIGALGNQLLQLSKDEERAQKAIHLARTLLRPVDWSADQHWDGIIGKRSPKGKLSIAGPKEAAYTMYAALSDADDPGYLKIRPSVQMARA